MKKDNKIYVIYIGVLDINTGKVIPDIEDYILNFVGKIPSDLFDGQAIYLPAYEYNTKIECINPKYITDQELINKHQEQIKRLNNELNKQSI